jgi:hypothetical protein
MGTSGTGIFADDGACDVRDEFIACLAAGDDPAESTLQMVRRHGDTIDDPDDGPVFWLALAATQWKYGCLGDDVRTRAIDVIDSGADVAKWSGAAAKRRQKTLDALRDRWMSPQPRLRRPRRRALPVIPSIRVPSPDGTACAVAYALGKSDHPEAPRMQVYLDVYANGAWGGGHVALADCEYDAVSLTWIAADTLQIGHPALAVLADARSEFYLSGRVVSIVYKAGDR